MAFQSLYVTIMHSFQLPLLLIGEDISIQRVDLNGWAGGCKGELVGHWSIAGYHRLLSSGTCGLTSYFLAVRPAFRAMCSSQELSSSRRKLSMPFKRSCRLAKASTCCLKTSFAFCSLCVAHNSGHQVVNASDAPVGRCLHILAWYCKALKGLMVLFGLLIALSMGVADVQVTLTSAAAGASFLRWRSLHALSG